MYIIPQVYWFHVRPFVLAKLNLLCRWLVVSCTDGFRIFSFCFSSWVLHSMQGLSLPLSSWHLTSVLLGDLEETHHFDYFVVWLGVLQKKCTVDAKHNIVRVSLTKSVRYESEELRKKTVVLSSLMVSLGSLTLCHKILAFKIPPFLLKFQMTFDNWVWGMNFFTIYYSKSCLTVM